MGTQFRITWLNSLATVLLCTAVVSWVAANTNPASFEERIMVIDAAASEECGVSADTLRAAPPNAAAVCAAWGMKAFTYSLDYPAAAPALYGLYGNLSEWHEVLDRYGHPVIPVVWSFYQEGSFEQQLEHDVGTAVSQILAGHMPTFASDKLSPIEQGARAIERIKREGHDLLSRYEAEGEAVATKPLTYTLRFVEELLIGGVKVVEGKLVRGEEVSAGEYGVAALEVAVLAVGGNALIAGLRKSGAAATTKALAAKGLAVKGAGAKLAVLKSASAGVGSTLLKIGKKVAPYAAVVGTGYLAVRHPTLVASAGSWVFEQLGVNPALAYVFAWLVVATVLWAIVWFFSWPARKVYRGIRYFFA